MAAPHGERPAAGREEIQVAGGSFALSCVSGSPINLYQLDLLPLAYASPCFRASRILLRAASEFSPVSIPFVLFASWLLCPSSVVQLHSWRQQQLQFRPPPPQPSCRAEPKHKQVPSNSLSTSPRATHRRCCRPRSQSRRNQLVCCSLDATKRGTDSGQPAISCFSPF
jgi:hypothetical protein